MPPAASDTESDYSPSSLSESDATVSIEDEVMEVEESANEVDGPEEIVIDLSVADEGENVREEQTTGRTSRSSKSPRDKKPRKPRKQKPTRSDWDLVKPLPVDESQLNDAGDSEEDLDDLIPNKVLRQLEPSPDVVTELLPYQKEFLFWAVGQEQTRIKGGILADEMGMGKTIQAISLIVTHRRDGELSHVAAPGTLEIVPKQAGPPKPALRLRGVKPDAFLHGNEKGSSLSRPGSPETNAAVEGGLLEPSPGLSASKSIENVQKGEGGLSEGSETVGTATTDTENEQTATTTAEEDVMKEVAAREAARLRGEHICAEVESASSLGLISSGATLVISPLVAVIQWRAEIERHVAPGALRVATFHGNKRTTDPAALAAADVVLTTYSTLESEYRRATSDDKVVCEYCGKRFKAERLHVHLKFFCGPAAKKSDALAKQLRKRPRDEKKNAGKEAELCPDDEEEEEEDSGLDLKQGKSGAWKKKTGKNLLLDKGKKKITVAEPSSPHDSDDDDDDTLGGLDAIKGDAASRDAFRMIMRQSMRKGGSSTAPKSVLHEIFWRRIVLDEAHCIKDRRSSTARATFALHAKYRWALSGTPLQNRVGELYSLIRFLRISPYSYYYCRACDCKHLDHPFRDGTRKCEFCPHGPLHHFCWWNKYVANPIKRCGYEGDGREGMLVLKNEILDRVLLRRTKIQQADVLALPPRVVMLRRDKMDAAEEDFYEALYTQSRAQFDSYVGSGTLLNNYSHIFSLLVRLRQAVNHPYLVVHNKNEAMDALEGAGGAEAVASTIVGEAVVGSGASSFSGTCGLCHDLLDESCVEATCGHAFCQTCLEEYVAADVEGAKACPTCGKALTANIQQSVYLDAPKIITGGAKEKKFRKESILSRFDTSRFQSSTKIEALREEIHRMLEREPSAKAIVFSQFTSFLDLCAFRLKQTGIQCVQLMGSQSMAQRNSQIDAFSNDPDVRVFLMSLKAGGIALNLTAASHCFLMDPWWNPASEWQAMDRIHRLGQYKPMTAVRFIIAGSIEERIVKLQDKKQLIFEGTVGQDNAALARLTEDDLKFLFG